MKISFRILLINFIIIVLISASSTFVFYSLTKKLITLQHSKALLNSVNDFVFDFQANLQEVDEDFLRIRAISDFQKPINLNETKIDFIFKITAGNEVDQNYVFIKLPFVLDTKIHSLENFINKYPNTIIKSYNIKGGEKIFYGKIIAKDFLENLSKRIRTEIAVLLNNIPLEVSNQSENEKYYVNIIKSSRELASKNNFDISKEELEQADFYATYYHSSDFYLGNPKISFIIFSKLPEAAELRSNINSLIIIISLAGIALSLILVMLFTGKLRKQIVHLSETAEKIRSGDIKQRVYVHSKDELGELGNAFNNMIDELERKESALNDYSEFIALINQNPTLAEISEVALTKIIKSIKFSAGRLSLIIDRKVKTISTFGIQKKFVKDEENIDLYQRAIEKSEVVELHFDENSPKLNSGLLLLDIKYILVYPIVYNRQVIAILELASISNPRESIIKYLDSIKEQLAVGLSNAVAFQQLENFVGELKKLNEEYQKQNQQISEQNIKLLELHEQLKEKAGELEIQREKAIESSVSKSQFLANMSHELKTPLNSVLGLTELIMNDKNLSSSNREKLIVVLRNGNRLMNLINDILNYSKTEAGKMLDEPEDFCFKDLINDLELQIIPLTKEKNLNFIVHNELNPDLILNADRKKISQIIINLLSNAVKFTEKGIIVLRSKLINNEQLNFEVIDSGIGISKENLQLIFEEFRQIDGTSTRKYSGTGLGLAISKKFAEVLGGKLLCESEIGKGSIFKLSIPVNIVAEKKKEAELTLFEEKGKGTVLVIDDKLENQLFIGEYLTSKKYEVMYASNINEAFERYEVKTPITMVLNFLNTQENGFDILKHVISDKKTAATPLVAYVIMNEINSGYGFPVFEYFIKPLSYEKLIHSILKYEKLTGTKVEKVVVVDDEGYDTRQLKEKLIDKNIYINHLSYDYKTVSAIAQMQADMVIANITDLFSERSSLLYSLQENQTTKKIPISVILPNRLDNDEAIKLNHSVKKTVTNLKNFPLDILKVIKDRLNLEEGTTFEDSFSIWEEQKVEVSNEEVKGFKVEKVKRNNIVLIVDDDADTLFTVGEMVKEAGCDIAFANNGVECLSLLRTMKPALILLDIMMPLMDGFETIKRIRIEQNYKDIPVYALTAKAMLSDKDVVIRNGFNDLIPKPVNAADLISKIEKLIISRAELKIKLDKG
jgi:signal transduction histidine kinase/CheY-like chemotaxis protein